MIKKKSPSAKGPKSQAQRSIKTGKRVHYPDKDFKIDFFPDGVAITAPYVGNPTGKGIPEGRGKVSRWSPASRRRMRDFMLTHQIRSDFQAYSTTFTIPGPVTSPEENQKLIQRFSVYLARVGGCAVWRKEIQRRGQIHWHCIVGLPPDPLNPVMLKAGFCSPNDAENWLDIPMVTRKTLLRFLHGSGVDRIKDMWFKCLDSLGPCEGDFRGKHYSFEKRSEWFGALKYSAMIDPLPETYGAWKRYLFDHTTKAKQYQIAEDCGRHWGKIGKAHFNELLPSREQALSFKAGHKFLRAYNRLCTPYVKCEGAMFGKRKGVSWRRAGQGRYVAFANPETMGRLCDWAESV